MPVTVGYWEGEAGMAACLTSKEREHRRSKIPSVGVRLHTCESCEENSLTAA